MNKAIGLLSRHDVGCTFAEWSVHWLNGQTNYFNVKQNSWQPLTNNPLRAQNSHNHKKNHPGSPEETLLMLNILENQQGLTSCYPSCGNENYNEIIQCFATKNLPTVYIKLTDGYSVFSQFARYLPNNPLKIPINNSESDPHHWREQIILSNRFLQSTFQEQPVHHGLVVESEDFWLDMGNTIQRIMDYFELSIQKQRLKSWMPVAKTWCENIMPLVKFAATAEYIADVIAAGEDKNVALTIEQQIVVQHILLFKHQLLVKRFDSWPDSTAAVHKLLEPNIHQFNKNQMLYRSELGYQ